MLQTFDNIYETRVDRIPQPLQSFNGILANVFESHSEVGGRVFRCSPFNNCLTKIHANRHMSWPVMSMLFLFFSFFFSLLSLSVFLYPSVYLSVCLPVCLSICLSIHLSSSITFTVYPQHTNS